MSDFFKVTQRTKKKGSRARLGTIQTAHGIVQTPAFVPVATKGTVKGLTPQELDDLQIQLSFVNTYHLVTHPGSDIIQAQGQIHQYSGMHRTLMSDSGGFQVFSLAQQTRTADVRGDEKPILIKIDESGVLFRSLFDGALIEFTPEKSMQYQMEIGADIHMAFDECVYYPVTHEYAHKSMIRTHDWLKRCISYKQTHTHPQYRQYLYGIIQGALYEDLRQASAKFIAGQNIDGVAIGGVSVGEPKNAMREQVRWVADYLPEDKPVHLLGIGHIDDILDLVTCGIDSFDCVEPTRLARMGILIDISHLHESPDTWTWKKIDITENIYKADTTLLEMSLKNNLYSFTFSYLHHLFKQKELLGYTYATLLNLYQMEMLMSRIREEIGAGNI